MQTIVVGYDESDPAQRALERAADLAAAFGSRVVVASVAPVPHEAGRTAGPIDPTDPPSRHEAELEQARSYLDGRGVTGDYVESVSDPARGIVAVAEERKADLVVVGTHDKNIVSRLLGQSVSETVTHKAPCDVLLVR